MNFSSALQHTIVWRVLNTLILFFINLLLVRLLGASISGAFFYFMTLLSFFILILGISLESGIGYYMARGKISGKVLLRLVAPVLIVQGLIASLILFLFRSEVHFFLSLSFILANILLTYFTAVYQARKQFARLNMTLFSSNLLAMIILLWFWQSQDAGYMYLATWVYILIPFLQCIILGLLISLQPVGPATGDKQGITKQVVRYSLIAFTGNLLFFLVTRIDYYFVERFCNDEALGNYIQVSKLGQLLVLVPTLMAAVVFPYSANASDSLPLHKLQALCRMVTLLFIPVALFILLTGKFLFPWLFGEAFDLMYTAMLYYLPGFFFLSIVSLLAAYGAGQGHIWSNAIASVFALAVMVAGDLLFIPRYGINGAAAVSSVAYLVCMVYLLLMYKRWWQTGWTAFFFARKTDIQFISDAIRFRKK